MPELTRQQLDAILHAMSRSVGLCKLGHCDHFADAPPLTFDEIFALMDAVEVRGLVFAKTRTELLTDA